MDMPNSTSNFEPLIPDASPEPEPTSPFNRHRRVALLNNVRPDFGDAGLDWSDKTDRDRSLDGLPLERWTALQLRRCTVQSYNERERLPSFSGEQLQRRWRSVLKSKEKLMDKREDLHRELYDMQEAMGRKADDLEEVKQELESILVLEDELRDLILIADALLK
ncbi:hypothetical protein GYMLUDRAFT_62066 [Collybiopsis luxurians FD-317 M1]|uniref:Uncharacterized protein n=1 Tax=Collybiopsis luxurians FD-317 M1 TaxID=944289 RepID=A0A0D0BNB4_9AGAR|nr:hypothetical protein GYMLUDRAFT_62066 [Collybiopsis luxurians FD-317 M1]